MGCSTTVVKYLVFFFNLIFAFAGIGLLVLGILLKLKNNGIDTFTPDKYHLTLPPVILIAIGIIIFGTSFFGCCGAIKESTCMLTTFSIILLTLLIIQVAIGAFAFLQIGDGDDLRVSLKQAVEKSYNQYNTSEETKTEFDNLQIFLQCCGVEGPQDWQWNAGKVPNSCCKDKTDCNIKSPDCYRSGCATNVFKWFKTSLNLLGVLALTVASIEIIGAIFGLCLSSSIKNQLRREAYA